MASEPQEFLELFGKRSSVIKPGLDRIRSAWEKLGKPGANTPTILVAGTNGKGSTSGLVWHMLAANDISCGLFSSPHLTEFRERIAISDQEVTNDQLVEILKDIKKTLSPATWDELSFFEINTLLALSVFAMRGTEVNVLEVGLGGRLDCTNIIDPLISVITSIGVDHTEFLGTKTEQIALEKAGIMRPGRICLWGGLAAADFNADKAIRNAAAMQNVTLKIAGEHFLIKEPQDPRRTRFTRPGYDKPAVTPSLRSKRMGSVGNNTCLEQIPDGLTSVRPGDDSCQIPLPARVQRWPGFLQRNFVMAAAAVQEFATSPELSDALKQKNISLQKALQRFGEPSLPWPVTLTGRFQHVRVQHEETSESVRLLIDVCHNPHGAKALASGLDETGLIPQGQARPGLLSILTDKDDGGIWQALEGKISEAFLFKIPSDRTWSQESTTISGPMFESFDACFRQAMARKDLRRDEQQPWLVCGSVAAVGEVFKYFKSQRWKIFAVE